MSDLSLLPHTRVRKVTAGAGASQNVGLDVEPQEHFVPLSEQTYLIDITVYLVVFVVGVPQRCSHKRTLCGSQGT